MKYDDDIDKTIPVYPGGHGIHEVLDQLAKQEEELKKALETNVRVRVSKSLKVIGEYVLEHADGREEIISGKRSFCRCGLSNKMPFCDNSHRKNYDGAE
jgi:CDGSH-type Zn-finger protein